jgi:phosphoesterase RecJ-like protein
MRMPDGFEQVIAALTPCKRVLLTTHVKPDGDALGSTAALSMALKHRGIESQIVLLSRLPRKYGYIYHEHDIDHFDTEKGWPADFSLDRYDAIVVLDTGTWSQLPGLRERIEKWPKPKIVIDHHLTQESWADVLLVDTSAGACGEIVEQLLQKWSVPIDSKIANALFLAIVSDTGWFQFSNTRPVTLRLAATLMEAGVDTDRVYQLLYQNERAERVALQAKGMQSLELLDNGRIAVMTLRKEDFAATQASVNDTENMINIPLQIRTVQVAVLFIDGPDGGPIRVSFRSKPGGLDVAAFAQQFGGGGHARASGLKLDATSLNDARDRVVKGLLAAHVPAAAQD